jgi:ATP-dependent Lon protease
MPASPNSLKSLPGKPSEEYLRKEAKRLARDGALQLAAAQSQLAHEYGYRSWAELINAVQSMVSATGTGSRGNPSSPAGSIKTDGSASDSFALLPLRGLVAFPHVSYPIFVGRPASIDAALYVKERKLPILLVAQKDLRVSAPSSLDMYEVGTLATVVESLRLPDGTLRCVIEGKKRVRVSRFIFDQEFPRAEAVEIEEAAILGAGIESLINSVVSAFVLKRLNKFADVLSMNAPEAFATSATTADSASVLADRIASELQGLEVSSKQALLEIFNPADRLERVLAYLNASS